MRTSRGNAVVLTVGMIAALCIGPAAQDSDRASLRSHVRSLLEAGDYEQAETAAEQLRSAVTTRAGDESLEAAQTTDLLVEALFKNGKGADRGTRTYAERAIQIKLTYFTAGADLALSSRGLANVLAAAGEISDAIALFDGALLMNEESPQANPLTADILDDLADALILAGRYTEAEKSLRRALAIQEASLGPDHRAVARTLELLVRVQLGTGDYKGPHRLLERALAIREGLGKEHPDLAGTFVLLGHNRWFEGDAQGARRFHVRALEIAQHTLRPDHPQVASVLKDVAGTVFSLGELAEARSFQERALSIAEKALGPSHPALADHLNDLADYMFLQQEYADARRLWERALRIVQDRRGPDHLDVATYAFNLGILHRKLGDFTEARRRLDQAASIWHQVLGADHPFMARALSEMAGVSLDRGLYAEAQRLFERGLDIRERRLGANHPDVALNLTILATTLEKQGRYSRADEMMRRAVGIWERSDTPSTPTFADVLAASGDFQTDRGNLRLAVRHYEGALAIRRAVFGISHPLIADLQTARAAVFARLGQHSTAFHDVLQADDTLRLNLRTILRYLPERQSLSYAAKRPKGIDLALSLLPLVQPGASEVFDAVVRSRALVMDEMAVRQHVSADVTRADNSPLWSALVSSRQRLANLIIRGPSDSHPEQYVAIVDEARRAKEEAERTLAERSTGFRNELMRDEVGLDAIRMSLPSDSALIAYARYDRTPIGTAPTPEMARPIEPRRTVPSYVAFVLRAGQPEPSVVHLGSAIGIDRLVGSWREEATGILRATSEQDAERRYKAAAAALRQRVWDPLRKYLHGAGTVFIVPDGSLNLVSFAALPVGETKYLLDDGPVIHYLSAERDVIAADPPSRIPRGLLALGGVAFDDASLFARASERAPAPARAPPASESVVASLRSAPTGNLRSGCASLQSMQFAPLAGTGREVHEVAKLWTDSPAEILESRSASERAFKRDAPGHRVLHLATHGFFLGNDCTPISTGTRSVGGLVASQKPQSSLRTRPKPVTVGLSENPLLMSGLALAGANRRLLAGADEDDGILTAEEVSGLNLEGVEWVVLSACDTGLGEIRAGEGVFGLRRAFQVAGARTVIMSLWPVDDDATRIWMRGLYRNRLQNHLNTAEAMRAASLGVLRERRARGQSTHPFYWAAFVAAGDWR